MSQPSTTPATTPGSAPVQAEGRWFAATPTQQGIWILDRIERLRPTYLLPSVVEFTGPVDHAVLVASVARAFGRHPALRSRFRLATTLRRIEYRTDGPPPEVGFIDAAAEGWSAEELTRLVEALCYTPFDLAEEAPARAEVIRVDPATTLLVLTVHHIVFDGWSRQALMGEIGTIYRATVAGRDPDLPPAVHPAEVVAAPSAEELAERVDQVVERLRGAPTTVDLPYDRDPAAGELSMVGAGAATWLDTELTEKLMAVAAAEGCTAFMAGIALLAGTLARAGRQRDFLFAVVWPGREDPAAADVIGMFMATLVLRVGLDEHTTWRELLRNARTGGMDAFVDADVPLDTIAAALDGSRDVSRPPLTPVLVNMAEVPAPIELASGVTGRYRPLEPQYSKWDLALFVRLDGDPGGRRLELSLDYPADLFSDATITDVLAALRRSAANLANFPEEAVLEPAIDNGSLDDPTARLELVRSVWREVLASAEIDDDISFFDAGGDSLRLVILVERLSQVSGRTLRTVDLFRAGTIRGQADLLAGPAAPTNTNFPAASRERLLDAVRHRRNGADQKS
jgi:aryl carrier-like protein